MLGSKPLASLSSGLLARKGQARPAMRRQDGLGLAPDDLGWNDMGHPAPRPAVLIERRALEQEFAAPEPEAVPEASAAPEPAPAVATAEPVAEAPAPVAGLSPATAARVRATGRSGKAAFTLRLDTDRHLRLRLASAVTNQSAQALVARALDAFLTTVPEVETLAVQLTGGKAR